jgi:phosphoribosyl-AMP cyclohydrolase
MQMPELHYDANGLIPAIAQDATTNEVLMLAWMSAEAVRLTLETGKVHYWSRSRQEIWLKGKTSGHTQKLIEFRYDCDRDAVLVRVEQTGPACHTNRKNCFFYAMRAGQEAVIAEPRESIEK